jgi:hypothetical protein
MGTTWARDVWGISVSFCRRHIWSCCDLFLESRGGTRRNYFGHGQAQAAMHTFPPTVPSAFFSRTMGDRPRPHYCYVHGFNVSHDGPACRVMDSDQRYTAAMKTATTPVGTGGNPNLGPPVRLLFRFPSTPMCLTCSSPASPTKGNSKDLPPNEEKVSAGLDTRVAHPIRGENHPSHTRVDGPILIVSPNPNPRSHILPDSPLLSRFSHPNPFSSLISNSESDSESDDEDETVALPPHPRDASYLPVTKPQVVFSLLCSTVPRPPVSLP